MSASPAARKSGSDRISQLSGTLAARGARNPGAFAAFLARRQSGSEHANAGPGIQLSAAPVIGGQGSHLVTCPACGHSGTAASFGTDRSPAALRTMVPSTKQARAGAPLTVSAKGNASALSNTREAVELATAATTATRHPVTGPLDVIVKRLEDGTALLRHRNGGAEIARMRRDDNGQWVATVNGKDLEPRNIQRTALMDAVGTYNTAARPKADPLQPPPQQTELMAEFGIPAMRSAALATPTTSSSGGPRVTMAAAAPAAPTASGSSPNGLSPRAQGIYSKLKAKGWPEARAMAFAKNTDRFAKKPAAA